MTTGELKNQINGIMMSVHNNAVEMAESGIRNDLFDNAHKLATILDNIKDEMVIYIVLEEYNDDGCIESNVLGVYDSEEKAQKRMKEQLNTYKSYGVFEDSDFEVMSLDDNSLYLYAESDDYYGKVDIIKQKIE